MKLSIIIPAFNESKTIGKILHSLQALKIPGIAIECIVVDDGSVDGTEKEVEKFKQKIKNLQFIRHAKNLGKGAAVKTGFKHAKGEYFLIQDADVEYDPKYIPVLLEPILGKKTQVVYGTRLNRLPNIFKEESRPLFLLHYFGNRMLSLLTSILYGQWVTDMETGYKLFPRKVLEKIHIHAKGFEFEPEITAKILKNKYKIFEVPITTIPRGYDEGKKINAVKDGFKALLTLVKYRLVD